MSNLHERYDKLVQEDLMQTKEGLKFLVFQRRNGHQVSDMTTHILEVMSDNGMSTEESIGYLQYLKSRVNASSFPRSQK